MESHEYMVHDCIVWDYKEESIRQSLLEYKHCANVPLADKARGEQGFEEGNGWHGKD